MKFLVGLRNQGVDIVRFDMDQNKQSRGLRRPDICYVSNQVVRFKAVCAGELQI